ncbi:MAG TPA: hypothetical protein V6D02_06005 [Candidatus Obscuribacterales bacterium]
MAPEAPVSGGYGAIAAARSRELWQHEGVPPPPSKLFNSNL